MTGRALAHGVRAGYEEALQAVRDALRVSRGSVRGAARALGIAESTLHGWLREVPGLEGVERQGRASVGERLRDWRDR